MFAPAPDFTTVRYRPLFNDRVGLRYFTNPKIFLSSLFIVFHFQFFFQTGSDWEIHILSAKFLYEIYLSAGLAAAIYVLVRMRLDYPIACAYALCFFCVSFMLMSAINAEIAFGQPVQYGLMETRRCLSYFSIFIFIIILSRCKFTISETFHVLLLGTVMQVSISLLNQTLFPQILLSRRIPDLDPRKLRIANGAYIYAVLGIFAVSMAKVRFSPACITAIIVATLGLLLVGQSKTLYFVVLMTCALSFITINATVLSSGIAIGSLIVMLFSLMQLRVADILGFVVENLAPSLGAGEVVSSGDSVRSTSINIILDQLSSNSYQGLGALSLQWNGGFIGHYGEHFFLADVGIFGEMFQVGFLYPIYIMAVCLFMIVIIATARSRVGRDFCLFLTLFMAIEAPVSGIFFQSGFLVAFMFFVSRARET